MTVFYEWDVETVADGNSDSVEDGEVLNHTFCASLKEAAALASTFPDAGYRYEIVLVRDDDRRAWAYLEDGKLPQFFSDANGDDYSKVPARFVKEANR